MKKSLFILAATMSLSLASASVLAGEFSEPQPQQKVINVCGGGDGGTYNQIAQTAVEIINRSSSIQKYNIIAQVPQEEFEGELRPEYRGSIANMDGASDGDCDIFITQPDALNWYRNEYPEASANFQVQATAGTEYVVPFCNKKIGDDLSILEDMKHPVVAVVEGSGDYAFFKNLGVVDDDYANIKMIYASSSYDAAKLVSKGDAVCSVAITSLDSVDVTDIVSAFNRYLVFAEASDGDFDDATYKVDGENVKLYTKFSVDKDQVSGIDRADNFGSQSVLSMQRQVVINDSMFDRFTNKESRVLRRVIMSAIDTTVARF